MITKSQIEHLRQSRSTPNEALTYTIDGPAKTQVHSSVEAERIQQILQGDRTMQRASNSLRDNMAFSSREGQAKSHFERSMRRRL